MRLIVSRSTPVPESANVTRMPRTSSLRQSREGLNRTVTRPPIGVASIAFANQVGEDLLRFAGHAVHFFLASAWISTVTSFATNLGWNSAFTVFHHFRELRCRRTFQTGDGT